MSGMEKIVAFDRSQSLDDFLQLPEVNSMRTSAGNGVVTFPGKIRKKVGFQRQTWVCGALGGTRTPTILLTATSRQRVYQFRHEREGIDRAERVGPDQRPPM